MNDQSCEFCNVVTGTAPSDVVHRDPDFIVFLDNRPLFPGHVLLCPTQHYETLIDLPSSLLAPLLHLTQLLARALETAVGAEGTFVAINNRISQSVPHLHVHVVPRRKRDGLKGFFWPRQKYPDEQARQAISKALQTAIQRLLV